MAVHGPFKVECGELFPHGLGVVSDVTALDDFDKSTRENRVQARDKDTGLPMWQVEVLDFDPQARDRSRSRSRRRSSRCLRRPWPRYRYGRWCWKG